MIVVTGGAGFIGSNLIKALNSNGKEQIIVVDELDKRDNSKILNGCSFLDFIDKKEYLSQLGKNSALNSTLCVFHQGACSDTTEQDGKYMMDNNYSYSKTLFHFCAENKIPFIYASSAAIYGGSEGFKEQPQYEKPLNIYARSKFLFDNYVRHYLHRLKSQVVGLRYFNVYGPGENHKRHMASVAYHVFQQIMAGESARLFKGTAGYADGEQLRDFVYVDDAVALNLWFMEHGNVSGVYNAGTGQPRSFNDVANTLITLLSRGTIEYIDFPSKLSGKYQSFTSADLTNLRETGCDYQFHTLEEGLEKYLEWLVQGQS